MIETLGFQRSLKFGYITNVFPQIWAEVRRVKSQHTFKEASTLTTEHYTIREAPVTPEVLKMIW